jgi:hypothetical protein
MDIWHYIVITIIAIVALVFAYIYSKEYLKEKFEYEIFDGIIIIFIVVSAISFGIAVHPFLMLAVLSGDFQALKFDSPIALIVASLSSCGIIYKNISSTNLWCGLLLSSFHILVSLSLLSIVAVIFAILFARGFTNTSVGPEENEDAKTRAAAASNWY